jgi:hypothetical protein
VPNEVKNAGKSIKVKTCAVLIELNRFFIFMRSTSELFFILIVSGHFVLQRVESKRFLLVAHCVSLLPGVWRINAPARDFELRRNHRPAR